MNFPQKREDVTSEFAKEFQIFIQNTVPKNFYFNLPEDKLSVHDLYKITDLVLNNSSTVGLEASLLGIPVIGCGDVLYSFDPSLQKEPRSKDEYTNMISSHMQLGVSAKRIIMAFRWLRYFSEHVCIDISDGYKIGNENFIYKILIRLRFLLSRFNLHFKTLSSLEVLFRSKTLINSKWLSYAITNNTLDHIDFKDLEYSNDADNETILIKKCFLQYCNTIENRYDKKFIERVSILEDQFTKLQLQET